MKLSIPTILFTAAIIGLLAAAYFLVIKQANARREALQRDTDEKQAALATLDRSTAGIHDIKAKIGELQQAVAFFESKLPPAKEMDKVLEEVWHLAEANSLQTKTIKTPADKRTANYKEQDMELSLSGDFSGFYQFVLQLEDMKRITRIKRMNLSKINDRDGAMQAEMTLSVFFEPETGANTGSARAAGAMVSASDK